MGCNVYANGSEIACKAGDGKVIAEFPDVCLSPPSPPAGPIPIPYPDTSFSKDMKSGSKTVKIKGKEVMLKDKSFYKTSHLGDEAATRSFGANLITHQITGKTFFRAWSMDVKYEGKNVDRHMDLTTSNHGSEGPGTPPSGINASSGAGGDQPSKEECNKAIKLLEQPIRLSEKLGKKLPDARKNALRTKIAAGTITSNDLPGSIQNEFPPKLKGKTLNEVRAACGKSK